MEQEKEEKFSYSKLSTYEQCPFKYFLQYVEKHFIHEDAVATSVGTLIHETEENIANQIMNNLFGVSVDYSFLIENIKTKYAEIRAKFPLLIKEKDKSGRTYDQKIKHYIEEDIYRLEKYMAANPHLQLIGAEKPFDLKFGNYLFHGVIDRVLLDTGNNNIIIEDIKTYAKPLEHKDLTTPLQFVFYTLAAKELFNKNEEEISCAYDLPFCDMRQDAGTSGYLKRGVEKINKLLGKVESKEFSPKPCPLCHWCVFSKTYLNGQPEEAKGLCPYFSHWTRDKKDMSVEYDWMGMEHHQQILEAFNKSKPAIKPIDIPIDEPIEIKSETRRFFLRKS